MSYYKSFDEYSSQSAFTSNLKFLSMCSGVYNKKFENKDQDKEDNKEDATPAPSDSTTTPPAATDKKTKCTMCTP